MIEKENIQNTHGELKMSNYSIRNVTETDLDRCYEIEKASYEGCEAATKEKIKKRIHKYPEGFIVMELSGMVVGFKYIRRSDSTHGGFVWHEMVLSL